MSLFLSCWVGPWVAWREGSNQKESGNDRVVVAFVLTGWIGGLGDVVVVDGERQCVRPGERGGDLATMWPNPVYQDAQYWNMAYSDTPPPRD